MFVPVSFIFVRNWFEIRDGPNSDSDVLQLPINASKEARMLSRTSSVFIAYYFDSDGPKDVGFAFSMKYSIYGKSVPKCVYFWFVCPLLNQCTNREHPCMYPTYHNGDLHL